MGLIVESSRVSWNLKKKIKSNQSRNPGNSYKRKIYSSEKKMREEKVGNNAESIQENWL